MVAAHVLGLIGLLLPVVVVARWLPTTHSGGGHPAVLIVFSAWGGGLLPLQVIGPLAAWLVCRRREPWASRQVGSALLFHLERLAVPAVLALLAPLGILVGVLSFGVGLLLYLVLAIVVSWIDLLLRTAFCVVAIRRAAAGVDVTFPSATGRLRRWWAERSQRTRPAAT